MMPQIRNLGTARKSRDYLQRTHSPIELARVFPVMKPRTNISGLLFRMLLIFVEPSLVDDDG